jgi:hypothetical protein
MAGGPLGRKIDPAETDGDGTTSMEGVDRVR